MIQYKVKGHEEHLRAIRSAQQHPPLVRIRIGTVATQGKVWRVREKKWEDVSRSAGDNMIAIRDNAKDKRKFCFLTEAERNETVEGWKRVFAKTLLTGRWSWPITKSLAEELGRKFIVWFKKHLRAGEGEKGPFKPVTEKTKKAKIRETKKNPPPPTMIRTGQVIDSLVSDIKRY